MNGLLHDLKKHCRVVRKTRKHSMQQNGQITYFQNKRSSNGANYGYKDGVSMLARERSSSKLKRSTISNRSRSSEKSRRSGTPDSKNYHRSLNYHKRVREHNAISAENMRFVTHLINVKPAVFSGKEIVKRVKQ